MIVFKCVRQISKPESLFLIELNTSEILLDPYPSLYAVSERSPFVCYFCAYAKIRKIFECTSKSQFSDTSGHREIPQWIILRTKKRSYKVNKVMETIRVCSNAAAALERKCIPTTGPYIRRLYNGQILLQGYYKFGFRDGIWISHDEFGEVTHTIEYDWKLELEMEEAVKQNDMKTMIQIIHDNWENCYGKIPGMEDSLKAFFAKEKNC